MPIAAIFAEEAALALASELAPYAAGEAALALGTTLGAAELAGLGTEAMGGAGVFGGAEAATQAQMAANAAAGGAGAGSAGINAAQVAAQQNAAMQLANPGITGIPQAPMGLEMPGAYVPDPMYSGMGIESQIPANQFIEAGSGMPYSAENAMAQANLTANATPPSALEAGMDKAIKFAEKNPFTAMSAAYMGANALGLLNPSGATFNNTPYSGPLSKYKLSPNFKSTNVNPLDFQYKPKGYAAGGGIMSADPYAIPVGYAEGDLVDEDFLLANNPQGIQGADQYGQGAGMGYLEMGGNYGAAPVVSEDQRRYARDAAMDNIYSNNNPQGLKGADPYSQGAAMGYMSSPTPGYAKGGSLSESIESYQRMLAGKQAEAPSTSRDVGIYYDQDPDTRYQDALTAAQIRQAKVNQRAYVSPPAAKRPTPMGKLNMPTSGKSKGGDDVEAAKGGIMHSSLGGYAAGGNPRLLKGPGDGMSDNIPATINGRQPARLADGEFVIPADVVSHLGNGSTEAGAKHLHAMMNKVRKARTGNPKQGKQINAKKYLPK